MLRGTVTRLSVLRHCQSIRRVHQGLVALQQPLKDEEDKFTPKEQENKPNSSTDKAAQTLDTKVSEQEEGVTASVQEHMLFGQIFERMQQREEQRKQQMDSLLGGNGSSGSSASDVKVTFGHHDHSPLHDIDPADISLVEYFRKEGEKQARKAKGKDSAGKPHDKATIIYNLFENLEQTIQNNKKRALEKSDAMKIDSFAPETLQNVRVAAPGSLRVDVKKLEAEERYRVAMEGVMQPYMDTLQPDTTSDYTLLSRIQSLLSQFSARDKAHDSLNRDSQPVEIINTIKQWNEEHPGALPEPLVVTVPWVVQRLLTAREFALSPARRYSLALYVYHQCKQCRDLSLYLNLCDAAFYNLLLRLSWANDRSVHRLVELTAEMTTNGILGDLETVALLDNVVAALERTYDDYVPMEATKDSGESGEAARGVLWSRRTRLDLSQLRHYLRSLKQRLTVTDL